MLKSSEGQSRNDVLDVKHLLQHSAPRVDDCRYVSGKKKKKKGGNKNHGVRNGSWKGQ